MLRRIAEFRYYGYVAWCIFLVITPVLSFSVSWIGAAIGNSAALLCSVLAVWLNRGSQRTLGIIGFFVMGLTYVHSRLRLLSPAVADLVLVRPMAQRYISVLVAAAGDIVSSR